jgi:hypothetical protein
MWCYTKRTSWELRIPCNVGPGAGIKYCKDRNGIIWETSQRNRGKQQQCMGIWVCVLAARGDFGSAKVGC